MGGVAILPRSTRNMLVRITVGSRAGEIVDMPPMVAARAIANDTAELADDEPAPPAEEVIVGDTETAQDVQPEVTSLDTGKKRLYLRKRR